MAGLSRTHQQVVHQLLREQKQQVNYSKVWQAIEKHFEVGTRAGNWLRFDAEQRRTLRELAKLEWGFDPLVGVPDGSRLEVAAQAIDEKIARQRPDDLQVLVKGRLPAPLPLLTPELSLRVPLASLPVEAIRQVLVIENLDSFDHWPHYSPPAELEDALVLYRGHGGLARGARQLLTDLPASVPVTLFTDYDPAGLAIATGMPRADALLIPLLDERLSAKGSRDHFQRQFRSARHLDGQALGGWQAIWDQMKAKGVSIKQQHMLTLAATLQRIPR